MPVVNQDNQKAGKSLFFPMRGVFKGEHKEKGVYLTDDGKVVFNKSEGARGRSVEFNLVDIATVTHYARFKFMFLLVVYRWEAINSLLFTDAKGQLLASLFVPNMKTEVIISLLKEIKKRRPEIKFGQYVEKFVKTGNQKVLMKQYWKAVWKGVRWWIIIPGIIFIFIFILLAIAG